MLRSLLNSSTLLRNPQRLQRCMRCIGLKSIENPALAGTMAEVKVKMMESMGLELGYVPIPKSREHLLKFEPRMEELPPRSMQDSFTSAIIPLSSNKRLQDMYSSLTGTVRVGRLMEDMDMFAVWVCHNHVKLPNLPAGTPLPYTFVTILVDRITLSDARTDVHQDVRLSGHVSWVGRSSLEIVVWLEQLEGGQYRKITRALFLMAARNATNTAAAPVNPIVPSTEEEARILAGGEARKKGRMQRAASSTFKVEPNDHEQTLMYELYKRTMPRDTMDLTKRVLPSDCRWMSEGRTLSTISSFPEHRNAHNKVFGGFLMRVALETSWVGAYLYARSRPKFHNISDVSFEKPVGVSSVLKTTSYVVYTEMNFMQMMTLVDVIDTTTGLPTTSNFFYSTLKVHDKVPEVLPLTYPETMWYIQGRRKFKQAMEESLN